MAPEQISHYELVRLIGRGGMGEVHEARDLKLRRRVALKFLTPELTADAAALARFEREAHSAAELNHPHIATVYAFEPEGDKPFIAMELLAGPSLRDRIAAGPLPVAEALGIARDVAAALAFAHRRGIAHRDIKPENLMFDEHAKIKVMDFGLARAAMASKLTVTGSSLGTPAYMSPEAIRGESGPAGDVWALGLVLWEMLAGRRAYPGENVMSVMFAIANDDPPPLREQRPEVPEAVEQLVAAMLVKDPAARLDAATVAADLAALTGVPAPGIGGFMTPAASSIERTVDLANLSSAPTQAVPSRAGAALDSSASTTTTASAPRLVLTPRRIAGAGAVMLAAAGVAASLLWTGARARAHDEALRLNSLGIDAGQAGKTEDARGFFLQALAHDRNETGALANLGLIALDEKHYALAESLFTAVLDHLPHESNFRAATLQNLAACDIERKSYPRAIKYLQEALALDSTAAGIYNTLGVALTENRQAAEGLAVLRQGIQRFPGEPYLYKNAGRAARDLGDLPGALGYLNVAVRLDSTFQEAIEMRRLTAQQLATGH